ncbi:MAG TPA: UvrD-helicase domain-containing protein [Verrucomicrobiae bacterium]|jgi:DNA helicase-2/ATP-dependent DNA helicase PcrA|nr:UvrD-helicase domain-containing protein [Verrucomicrobiae bacterium]
MTLLDELNSGQLEAATTLEGPVLILAGAGTGKTRAMTYRIAHLILQGVPGSAILAVTFTNKAAEQMKERVRDLLVRQGRAFDIPWIGTFHAFSAWLLRREGGRLGLPRNFKIFDADDQTAAVKLALEHLKITDPGEKVRGLLERISFAKNHAQTAAQVAAEAAKRGDSLGITASKVYDEYEKILRKAGSLDFDDLLLRAAQVLRQFPDARANWQKRFRYLHVDEYQDTNRVQYDLLGLLINESRNLCVVGDEDQSIYRWRGADVGNILRFAEDFSGARVVRLEENYRSTQKILDAAAGVVANNRRRLGKNLRATKSTGANLAFFEARDSRAEAEYVADRIRALQEEDPANHVAVLYRTNAQSRSFEEAMRGRGMRYRMLGGFSFFQRAEIKDALAYARLGIFPDDDIALLRVINTPPRGIGKTTVDSLSSLALQHGTSLWGAIGKMLDPAASGRAVAPLRDFRDLIADLQAEAATASPADLLRSVLNKSGYLDMLSQRDSAEDTARADNLRELVNAMAEGAERGETLSDFLDRAALVSDADNFDEDAQITLMTLHSAKGLEFDHVFLTGMEEGVFPHSRSQNDDDELEEERRLCYVGMTRAKQTLTLTRAVYRRMYGSERLTGSMPSRFLQEVPAELIDTAAGSLAEAGETRRYEPDPEYSYSQEEFARRMRRSDGSSRATTSTVARPRSSASPRVNKKNSNPLIGQRVRHATYGAGTIIDVEEDGEDRKFTVRFSDYGTKKLIERYANLTWA